jgi:DNA-binding response OmpR family regulator
VSPIVYTDRTNRCNWLLVKSEPVGNDTFVSSKPSARDPGSAPRRLRIIVADDDRDTVLSLMMILREEGHEVLGVHEGKQVLATLAKFAPDVVVLDIAMPMLSGWEVAGIIKERWGVRRPMLIGVSGKYKQMSDRLLSEVVGFDHYLMKPYEPSALLRLIEPLRYPRETL